METLNAVEARRNFPEVMTRVAYGSQRVVIERKGRAMVALISIAGLRRLETLDQAEPDELARRLAALAQAAARAGIRAERTGVPLPDSGETLPKIRGKRSSEPADLR